MHKNLTRISSLSEFLMKEIEKLCEDQSFKDIYVKDCSFQA